MTSVDKATLPERDNEFFGNLSVEYEKAFSHDEGLHRIIDRLLSFVPSKGKILDCGCGTGKPVADKIANASRLVYGIDLSQKMIDVSREQVPTGVFERCNMLEYSPSERFNGIVANLSLFYLTRTELTSLAQKWYEWLVEDDGYLLIGVFGADDCSTTPDMLDADGKFARDIPWTLLAHRVWINLFTKAGWKEVLEQAGFSIVHTESDVFMPPKEAVCDDEPHYYVIARKGSS